jgi:hypothetical protein
VGLLDSPLESITVLGGDFNYAAFYPSTKRILLAGPGTRIEEPLRELIDSIEQTSEERAGMGPGIGWGIAGAVVAGPVGLLAGALLGSSAKKVVFIAKLKDGRKFMGRTSPRVFNQLLGAIL